MAKNIEFVDTVDELRFLPNAYFVRSTTNRDDLLQALYDLLSFPGYFGFNWDALEDVLTDEQWLAQRKLILVHRNLPALSNHSMVTYLDILSGAIASWSTCVDGGLRVVFPVSTLESIRWILESKGRSRL